MGRMCGPGKGISSSVIPYSRLPPSWCRVTPEQVIELVIKLAKKGGTPSSIGAILRDTYCVPLTKPITHCKIKHILMQAGKLIPIDNGFFMFTLGLFPDIPEDLFFLAKKGNNIRTHLSNNPNDKSAKYASYLVESRIHRLTRYFKKKGLVPPTWK